MRGSRSDIHYNVEIEENPSPRRSTRYFSSSQSRRERGKEIVSEQTDDAPSSSRNDSRGEATDRPEIRQEEIQNKIHDIKGLFSGNQTERKKAESNLIEDIKKYSDEEIASAKKIFYDLKKYSINSRDKNIKASMIERLAHMPVANSLCQNIEAISVNKFTTALADHFKQELKTAAALFEWAKTFPKLFGLHEEWVQDGIRQQLTIAFEKCQTSDKPSMADANFKEAIRESLKDGIPVKEIPMSLCSRNVTRVSPENKKYDNSDLIRALLKGAHFQWHNSRIEEAINQMVEKTGIAKEGAMLDLKSEQGKHLIENMKTAKLIEPNRDILVYRRSQGKIQCSSITDKNSSKSSYAILIDDENKVCYAIQVPKTPPIANILC